MAVIFGSWGSRNISGRLFVYCHLVYSGTIRSSIYSWSIDTTVPSSDLAPMLMLIRLDRTVCRVKLHASHVIRRAFRSKITRLTCTAGRLEFSDWMQAVSCYYFPTPLFSYWCTPYILQSIKQHLSEGNCSYCHVSLGRRSRMSACDNKFW